MDNGWFRGFTSLSTVFQSYRDDWRVDMKGCKHRLRSRRFSPPAGFEPAIPWSEVGIFKAIKHKLLKGVLTCDILEAHFSSYFSIYASSSSLWLYHEQNRGYSSNGFHTVYVRKIWKIGSTCGFCLYVYFSVLKSVHMETPTLKSDWSDFVTRQKSYGQSPSDK